MITSTKRENCSCCHQLLMVHDDVTKWKHFPALLGLCEGNSSVTGEFPSQRSVTRSFDVFFDLSLNKRLSKPSRRRWFETALRSLWRHSNNVLRKTHRYCASGPQPFNWMNNRGVNAWNNGLMLFGKFPKQKGMLGGNFEDAGWKCMWK